ncbi:carboxypeptidase-like regulatory domain-containing protein [Methanolobus sp. ZRKC3]|uniref:carboxypeptidase-like regulatory domain-containing protein n=1 Tax=Methanolobus sp. ZRKC3 TaxID=3125786 RepID=UPI0032525747
MTIIGMVGMCAIMSAVLSTPMVVGAMYATVNNSSFTIYGDYAPSPELLLQVFDQGDLPVGGANVIVWSPCRDKVVGGVTDGEGRFVFSFNNVSLPPGKNEAYISVKVMQEGYMDYSNDFLVKVRKAPAP